MWLCGDSDYDYGLNGFKGRGLVSSRENLIIQEEPTFRMNSL